MYRLQSVVLGNDISNCNFARQMPCANCDATIHVLTNDCQCHKQNSWGAASKSLPDFSFLVFLQGGLANHSFLFYFTQQRVRCKSILLNQEVLLEPSPPSFHKPCVCRTSHLIFPVLCLCLCHLANLQSTVRPQPGSLCTALKPAGRIRDGTHTCKKNFDAAIKVLLISDCHDKTRLSPQI